MSCSFATAIVLFFLFAGTLYDFYLEYLKKKRLEENCAHFNAKLDMTMPDAKRKNGKCALYVVNNNSSEIATESNANRTEEKRRQPLMSKKNIKIYFQTN